MNVIKSISYDQHEILRAILKLHVKDKSFDCDATYGMGNFYKGSIIPMPKYRFDIEPKDSFVTQADSRNLPLESESIKSFVFDPPFLATTGKSLKENKDNNAMLKRFGWYPSEKELFEFYKDSLKEAHRVLKPHGILVFKCQDKVSSGKQIMSHVHIINEAEQAGFYVRDFFILLAKNRLTADWQAQNQKTARKYHCYFIVFEKA